MVSIIGEIDETMLLTGKFVHRYFTDDFVLYEVGKTGVVEYVLFFFPNKREIFFGCVKFTVVFWVNFTILFWLKLLEFYKILFIFFVDFFIQNNLLWKLE